MPFLPELRDALPAYAADLRADLDSLGDDRELSPEERWGCLLACAFAAGEPQTLRRVAEAAAEPLGERGVEAAKSAAAVTILNDIYFGARGALRNQEYATMPSGLSLEALRRPGADRDVVDLWCFSVSALHRCAPCMDAQDEELRRRGVPPERLHAALRLAAVVGAVARVLAAEAVLSEDEDEADGPPAAAGAGDTGEDPENGGDQPAPAPAPAPDDGTSA